jgi:hypothetical protein
MGHQASVIAHAGQQDYGCDWQCKRAYPAGLSGKCLHSRAAGSANGSHGDASGSGIEHIDEGQQDAVAVAVAVEESDVGGAHVRAFGVTGVTWAAGSGRPDADKASDEADVAQRSSLPSSSEARELEETEFPCTRGGS